MKYRYDFLVLELEAILTFINRTTSNKIIKLRSDTSF